MKLDEFPKSTIESIGHQRAAELLHKHIITIFGFLALACIAGGVFGIYKNAQANTKLDILGAHLATGDVGVAFVGIGLIISYFTVRAVLRSQRDLAALPADREPAFDIAGLAQTNDAHRPLELAVSLRPFEIKTFKCILNLRNPSQFASAEDIKVNLFRIEPLGRAIEPLTGIVPLADALREKAKPLGAIHPQSSTEVVLFLLGPKLFEDGFEMRFVTTETEYRGTYELEHHAEGIGGPTRAELSIYVQASARGRAQVSRQFIIRCGREFGKEMLCKIIPQDPLAG